MRSPLIPAGAQIDERYHNHAYYHLTQGLLHDAGVAFSQALARVASSDYAPDVQEKRMARIYRARCAARVQAEQSAQPVPETPEATP